MKLLFIISCAVFVLAPSYLGDDDIIQKFQQFPGIFGHLVIQWAGIIDNGEGSDFIHGLEGSIHIYIFDKTTKCPGGKHAYTKPIRKLCLCGLHKKAGCCGFEWLDLEEKNFDDMEIFKWRSEDDSVLVFIFESDPGPGRKNDPLFCGVVKRSETLNSPGIFYNLHHQVSSNFIRKIQKAVIFNRLSEINPSLSNKNISNLYWFKEVIWEDKKGNTKIGLEKGMPKMFIKMTTIDIPAEDDFQFFM